MSEERQREIFKKLTKVILELMEKPEYTETSMEELYKIWADNLSEVMSLAYDLNLSVEKLKAVAEKSGEKPKVEELGRILGESLEKEKTYVLLNYYYYKFIQAYLKIVKREKLEEVERLLRDKGVEEGEIKMVKEAYTGLVGEVKTGD